MVDFVGWIWFSISEVAWEAIIGEGNAVLISVLGENMEHFMSLSIFIRNKESREIHKKKGKVRPKFSLHRQMTSDLCLNIAYFNVNGFDYQSSWAIERIMQKEVYFDVFTLSHKWKFCIFSCAPGLWPGAQLYIWGMSLSRCLTAWVSEKVENICQYRC